jgi:hypothetical protein
VLALPGERHSYRSHSARLSVAFASVFAAV